MNQNIDKIIQPYLVKAFAFRKWILANLDQNLILDHGSIWYNKLSLDERGDEIIVLINTVLPRLKRPTSLVRPPPRMLWTPFKSTRYCHSLPLWKDVRLRIKWIKKASVYRALSEKQKLLKKWSATLCAPSTFQIVWTMKNLA